MFITQDMQSYMQDLKAYSKAMDVDNIHQGVNSEFEKIYQDAQDSDVDLSSAKIFLHSLDEQQMQTLKADKHLADDINIGGLSNEGAYNLLVHRHENLDYNQDGDVDVGLAQIVNMLPQDAPAEFRDKIIATFQKMNDNGATAEDMMMAEVGTLFKDMANRDLQKQYDTDPAFRALLRENGVYSMNVRIAEYDENWFTKLKHDFENPIAGEYSSPKFKEVMNEFFNTYSDLHTQQTKKQPSLDKMAFEYKTNTHNL